MHGGFQGGSWCRGVPASRAAAEVPMQLQAAPGDAATYCASVILQICCNILIIHYEKILHTEKYLRNLIKSTRNQIVSTIFRLIWHQTNVRLVPNQSENGKYNLISGWFNKISEKNSLCVVLARYWLSVSEWQMTIFLFPSQKLETKYHDNCKKILRKKVSEKMYYLNLNVILQKKIGKKIWICSCICFRIFYVLWDGIPTFLPGPFWGQVEEKKVC